MFLKKTIFITLTLLVLSFSLTPITTIRNSVSKDSFFISYESEPNVSDAIPILGSNNCCPS